MITPPPPISLKERDNSARRRSIADFLRPPPFPGAKVARFGEAEISESGKPSSDVSSLVDLLRLHRVGGTYWGAQPLLPPRYYLTTSPSQDFQSILAEDAITIPWPGIECDPWHMLSGAIALLIDRVDERSVIASALGVPVYFRDPATGNVRLIGQESRLELERLLRHGAMINPFTNALMGVEETIELCGHWRTSIERNRSVVGGLGFAFWKQKNVAALLWNGTSPFHFIQSPSDLPSAGKIAVWRSRSSSESLRRMEETDLHSVEVEDGFLRSSGLGADCIPPLSIIVDESGVYFDPSRPSDLEKILQSGKFDREIIERARSLRAIVVRKGLGKYGKSDAVFSRPGGVRKHILVPGQVEDDRSVKEGGGGITSNIELLRRVREAEPEAFILYKPHPDVFAGHRTGHASDAALGRFADVILPNHPMAPLLAMVDAVHVNTSLTGFEALLREKPVTTYGAPFYSGWGLTVDRGPVPSRRTARRTLDELVAATLLIYPRYMDPVTGLPCPAEVVVQRLSEDDVPRHGIVVRLRRWRGMVARQFQRFVG